MLNKHARWIFTEPITRLAFWLHSVGVSPNVVTCIGFSLTFLSAIVIAQGNFVVGGLIFALGAILDMLDGTLARLSEPSIFGAFLDSTLDRYSESSVLLALVYHYLTFNVSGRQEVVLIFFVLVGSIMVSYTRARAEGLNVECKVGFLQRPERVVLLLAGLLSGGLIMLPILWLLAILTNFTALQRIYEVYWRTTQTQMGVPPQEKT